MYFWHVAIYHNQASSYQMGDTYSNTTHHKSLKVVVFVQWRKIAKKKIKEIEIRLMTVLLLEKSILNFKTKRWQKKKIISKSGKIINLLWKVVK